MKPHIVSEVNLFPCSEMMGSLYEIIYICTAVVDESEIFNEKIFDLLEPQETKRGGLKIGNDASGDSYIKGGFTHVLLKTTFGKYF